MDELKIGSKLIKGLISGVLKTMIKKKCGCEIDIRLDEFNVVFMDGKAHIHISADAETDQGEIVKILKKNGLY